MKKFLDIISPTLKKSPERSIMYSYPRVITQEIPVFKTREALSRHFSWPALFIFFVAIISYFELVYRLWVFKSIDSDFIFSVLFAFPATAILFIVSVLSSGIKNKIITTTIILVLTLTYGVQLVYFSIFKTPLSLYSLIGAKDATQFFDVAVSAMLDNSIAIGLLFVPMVFLLLFHKFFFLPQRPKLFWLLIVAIVCIGILSYEISIISVRATRGEGFSQYAVYYDIASPELSIKKIGVLTTMRLDLQRILFGFEEKYSQDILETLLPLPVTQKIALPEEDNVMKIDFPELFKNEQNPTLFDMHTYFASNTPTKKNAYTGMFKGKNIIIMLAESFSPYAISPELTPTLHKMSTEGFVFNNFYNPIWGVSTSDGEYILNTGLIPKSGVWSMLKSGKNYLPFALGNQFKKLDYLTKAYHNHTYTYYGRDKSIPNLGYDYKGIGNGVNVKKTWPESDLEMIDVTADEYISSQPFAVYYITVSGHLEYNFSGNYIAKKNKSYVAHLPYSDMSKAYIAANLELEFAVKSLMDKLEVAGIAENTVIAIVPDHYPYGLSKESIDELAGHQVENNFELYKSVFILWNKGMKPVLVDRLASPLDVLPTISNLFGLEYDSRLLIGRDIFSDTSPLVIFLNRSWITDNDKYDSSLTQANYMGDDNEYQNSVNKIVADKFKYSAQILEKDYYRKTVPQ